MVVYQVVTNGVCGRVVPLTRWRGTARVLMLGVVPPNLVAVSRDIASTKNPFTVRDRRESFAVDCEKELHDFHCVTILVPGTHNVSLLEHLEHSSRC